MQLEAAVARLRGLALDDAVVGLGLLLRVVDLVGAAEDVPHARHVELLRQDVDVEAHVAELRALHRERRVGRRRAGGAALGVVREDGDQLRVVRAELAEDALLPQREAEDVREVHLRPRGDHRGVGVRRAAHVEPLDRRVERRGDRVRLVLLLQKVGVDRGDALQQAHLLDLLVLDVAAQAEDVEELLEVDQRRRPTGWSPSRRPRPSRSPAR